MNQTTILPLPYNPDALPRETARHYIPATEQDIQAMLGTLGLSQEYRKFKRHFPAAGGLARVSASATWVT